MIKISTILGTMKKLLLTLLALASLTCEAQTMKIDSVVPNSFYIWNGETISIYMKASGFSPSYPLTMVIGGRTVIDGTYQQLVDSNYRWSFRVPHFDDVNTSVQIVIYNAVKTLFLIAGPTGIAELEFNKTIVKKEYYTVTGQMVMHPTGPVIECVEYSNKTISRKLVYIIQ